jgi:hypothetical protein
MNHVYLPVAVNNLSVQLARPRSREWSKDRQDNLNRVADNRGAGEDQA